MALDPTLMKTARMFETVMIADGLQGTPKRFSGREVWLIGMLLKHLIDALEVPAFELPPVPERRTGRAHLRLVEPGDDA